MAMEPRRYFQILVLVVGLVSLILAIARAYYGSRYMRCVLVAPIIFLGHVSFYYMTVLLSQEGVDWDHILLGNDLSFHAWAAGLSLHAIITVCYLVYAVSKRY